MTDSASDALGLVRIALDEFEDRSLTVSLRRAVRIATILGDSYAAARFSFEVSPVGGSRSANAEQVKRLLVDDGGWGDPDGAAGSAIEDWMKDRRHGEGEVMAHTIEQLELVRDKLREAWDDDAPVATAERSELLERFTEAESMLQRTRARVFFTLCGWERTLRFASTNRGIFGRFQRDVDLLLGRVAPTILDMFNAAFDRLRDVVLRSPEASADEELSQAVTTCRRILKAVADHVYPAPATAAKDSEHPLTDSHYRNRLTEFVKATLQSETYVGVLSASVEDVYQRFAAVDKLTSKGVHAELALAEAEFCALSTYLLAGELVRVHSMSLAAADATEAEAQSDR